MSSVNRTNKYQRWLAAALEQLNKDFLDDIFQPENESDVQCHLYHLLLSGKDKVAGLTNEHLVLSEYKVHGSQKRIDLAVVKKTKHKIEPRLLIEIKETRKKDLEPAVVESRVKNDINKLRRLVKQLLVKKLAHAQSLSNPTIYFFFRGARGFSIGMETNRKLEALQQKYPDVDLQWGPH